MASATFTLLSTCPGGCHAVLNVAVDGGATRQIRVDKDDIRTVLTPEQIDEFIVNALRIKARGATRAQITTALQNGFTMTL